MNRTVTSIFLAFVLLLAGCSPPTSVSVQLPEPEYWPTAGWQSATPESQGMDSELLAQMIEQINSTGTRIHSVLVIRNGYVVTEAYFHPYTRDTKVHIQSVTKSVIGMQVGKAIGDGLIGSAEDRLVDYYPNRVFENPGRQKSAIRLKHLLSMSSGLDCQEFSGGPRMEESQAWVPFMLDRPVTSAPGKVFGYCNGNAHLLSSILEKTTGMSAREYANRTLFAPLGIPDVIEVDWGSDPQQTTLASYGLHLRPADLAKLAYLYLHNGKWDGQQLLPAQWVANSTTQHVQKEDGSGYGYLWTVYPGDGHYAALGLGGQQVHVYPSRNLIVVVTASLESFAEAPEIECLLNDIILPAIRADAPLAENAAGVTHLEEVLQTVANPVQAVPPLPSIANEISKSLYTFGENPMGWQTLELFFEPGAPTAEVLLNKAPLVVGMDNIYRLSTSLPGGELLLRGHWEQDNLFILDYPYPLTGSTALGELGESEFHFHFTGDRLDVVVQQLVFGGEGILFTGSK
jgi:CubicO group peptidase (beta-lactamase class C family)